MSTIQPYPIHYETLNKYFINTAVNKHHTNSEILALQASRDCAINDKKVEYQPLIRYLGVDLHAQDPKCIISSHHTTKAFQNKLQNKENTLFKNFRSYKHLPLHTNINLTRAMFAAYTEIFGQVMPMNHIDELDKYCLESLDRLLPLKCYEPDQYHTYSEMGTVKIKLL